MAFRYKIDILRALKEKGYSTYRIRKEKLMGEKTMTDIRQGKVVFSEPTIETLCNLLSLDIGDIIEHYDTETGSDEPDAKGV